MRIAGHVYDVMTQAEIERIHSGALRILSEMGMEVQNRTLLDRFAAYGFPIDERAERVRFPSRLIESFIADSDKHEWNTARASITASAGIYEGLYHDPETGKLVPWDEEKLAFYCSLARQLPRIKTACVLGSRIPCSNGLDPLFERYYAWKYGALEFGSLHAESLDPYLLELYQLRADQLGKTVSEVFRGEINAISALKLGRPEAAHIVYFMDHGLRVIVGGGLGSHGPGIPHR
ncbi:MAG: trimethylamine methyltransferase family protein [Acidobacteriota bacterium]